MLETGSRKTFYLFILFWRGRNGCRSSSTHYQDVLLYNWPLPFTLFCLCVVTTAGKEDVGFPPPITFFRFRGGGQDGDVSSTRDDGDGGASFAWIQWNPAPLCRLWFWCFYSKVENLMKRLENHPAHLSSTDV